MAGKKKRKKQPNLRSRIVSLLIERGPVKLGVMVRALKASYQSLNTEALELRRLGVSLKDADGVWSLAPGVNPEMWGIEIITSDSTTSSPPQPESSKTLEDKFKDLLRSAGVKKGIQTIAPGAKATLEVVFTPQSTGPRLATLAIWFADPAMFPARIELYGNKLSATTPTDNTTAAPSTDQPDITIDPKPLNFGSVTVGSSRESPLIRVRNTGSASLTVGNLAIEGPDASDFSKKYDNAALRTIHPGRYEFLRIVFRPSSAGAKSATLLIPSNDPDEPIAIVELLGEASATPQVNPPVSYATPIPEPEPVPDWALLIGIILSGAVLIFVIYLLLKMDI